MEYSLAFATELCYSKDIDKACFDKAKDASPLGRMLIYGKISKCYEGHRGDRMTNGEAIQMSCVLFMQTISIV